jgi:CRP/FNR family transcriptional regulator
MIRILDCKKTSILQTQTSATVLRHLMGAASFALLGLNEMQQLESFHWSTRVYEKGSTLIEQGGKCDQVSIVLSGWAFRFQSLPEGKRQILDFIFAGSLIGFSSGCANWYGVEAVTECTIATLSHLQFRSLLRGCPALAIQVAERISDSEMRAHEHMTSLGRKTARQRVVSLIGELMASKHTKVAGTRAEILDLPITQIMIGDALGLSNEHVCRTLRKLIDDGVIQLSRHALRVLDPRALMAEAGAELPEFDLIARELVHAA